MSSKYIAGKLQKEILSLVGKGIKDILTINNNLAKNHSKQMIGNSLDRLKARDIINLGGEKIVLTERGKSFLSNIEKQDILINKVKWDGTWHIVAYDIPEEKKNERDWLRRKLKELDFVKIQASMWLIPYECKEEVAILVQSLGLSPFVMYLSTDFVPGEEKLKKRYSL